MHSACGVYEGSEHETTIVFWTSYSLSIDIQQYT